MDDRFIKISGVGPEDVGFIILFPQLNAERN